MNYSIAHKSYSDTSSLTLGIATGGATDVKLKPTLFSWGQFKDRLRSPRIGEKGGSYYIRGGDLLENKRSDENLKTAQLIILDGDSSFDPQSGEIVDGAPDIGLVCDVLMQEDITFFAHTSHSYVPDQKWKYRVLIPADLASSEELDASIDWLMDKLHAAGVFLLDVPENHRWSQPWFTSRVKDRRAAEEFIYLEHTGKAFDPKVALDWYNQTKKTVEVVQTAAPVRHTEGSNDIRAFNDEHGKEWVCALLERHGYRFGYFDRRMGGLRFMSPSSSTGTYGLVVFQGKMGHWCTYSHHGASDPLSGKVFDPFALAVELEYGGDIKFAARELLPKKEKAPSVVEQLAERAKSSLQIEDRQIEQPRPDNSSLTVEARTPFLPDESKEKVRKKIELIPWANLRDEPVRWLVKDILPANSFSALYGRPGSYKSFAAIYLAACIATGSEAFGKPCKQGAVVYIAGEGGAGLKRRRDALVKKHQLGHDIPVYFIKAQLNLRSSLDDMTALVEAVRALQIEPSLIVVDTLARAYAGGEENSAAEMGQFVAVIGAIMEQLGCGVLVIHHAGKDESRGMRGSSALLGAVDSEMECIKVSPDSSPNRYGKLTVTKQKDGEDGVEYGFQMETVPLSDIDPEATSLSLNPTNLDSVNREASSSKARVKLHGDAQVLMAALQLALAEAGESSPGGHIPAGVRVVRDSVLRQYWRNMCAKAGGQERTAWGRATTGLIERGLIAHWAPFFWIIERAPSPSEKPAGLSEHDAPF